MTDTRRRLLEFIRDNGGEHSVKHMGQAIGLSSTASTHYQLQTALELGQLKLRAFDCECNVIHYELTTLGVCALKDAP